MINDKQTILTATEQSVQSVEQTLAELTDVENKITELEENISELSQFEAELLAGDQNEEQKTKSLLKLRATVDVRKSNVGKFVLEREALKDEIFFLAVRANNLLGAVEQALISHRVETVCNLLSQVFDPAVVRQMREYANYSLPVKALSREPFIFVQPRFDLTEDAAKKMRAVWDRLVAAVNSEETEPAFVAPKIWLEPVVRTSIAPMNREVQFAGSKS